jgi:hypothetical protein
VDRSKNTENSSKEREIDRLISQSKEFSKKYAELKPFLEKIQSVLEEKKPEYQIPVSAFKTNKLGMLEITVKYLVEENELTIQQISKLLNRSYTTIHSTYQKTKQKHPEKFAVKKGFGISALIFSNRKVSPLHSITSYLKDEKQMTFTQIAKALDRDVRNISFTYHKYKTTEMQNISELSAKPKGNLNE